MEICVKLQMTRFRRILETVSCGKALYVRRALKEEKKNRREGKKKKRPQRLPKSTVGQKKEGNKLFSENANLLLWGVWRREGGQMKKLGRLDKTGKRGENKKC